VINTLNEESDNRRSKVNPLTTGVGVGVAMGVCFWLAFDNIVLGITFGMIFGIGSTQTQKRKQNRDDIDLTKWLRSSQK